MAQHDTKSSTSPSTALFLLLNALGFLLLIIGLIATVAMTPPHWLGIGITWFAGLYSLVMAQMVKRRPLRRR
ncbi:hypothetical protein [Yaniella halotolerans]|uniref:hypothetical protein n=1 Tax=Yaniella halotolerans TaxID=225453 RepID=UPI0003B2F348|nr:hypothetical protein [Yaniella halotolerans]